MHNEMKKKVTVDDTMKGYRAPVKVSKAAWGGIRPRPPKLKQDMKDY